jgi:2'-5' RNA ligase
VDGLNDLDIKTEDRQFNPHLTIGRIKHLNDKENLNALIKRFENSEMQIIPVYEVILYESILFPTGAVYKPLTKFKLE